ncbi:MAG: 3-deoxy-D-manno-octulosonic acid kinase [Woeseia sp.]
MSERRFTARGWENSKLVSGSLNSTGRGETLIVSDDKVEFVLRHYMRGGFIRHIVEDVYLWQSEERTRSFAEWRMLHKLFKLGLRVPRPVAARYRRNGIFYTADLLTSRIPGIVPLSERLRKPTTESFWFQLGEGIERFHRVGACHADLNAYNVQIGKRDGLWLLDFDRGSFKGPGTWKQQNLARLHRSLLKIRGLDSEVRWKDRDWQTLLDGYFQASRSE